MEVDDLEETVRGAGGFGSTGVLGLSKRVCRRRSVGRDGISSKMKSIKQAVCFVNCWNETINPSDPFLSKLASVASTFPDHKPPINSNSDTPPHLDLFDSPKLMASPAQVERSVSYNEHRPRKPPPDLPSLLLHGRIVYIGMPISFMYSVCLYLL
ncbi:hypothetical protein ACHQM5_001072 [Ranunculus cassubicifolius]